MTVEVFIVMQNIGKSEVISISKLKLYKFCKNSHLAEMRCCLYVV